MAGALFLGTSYLALGTVPFSFVADGSGDGGTITINVERTDMMVAPDSVRFTVDLSAATFDTQGPNTGAGEIYDARMHDLIYLWDFDDAASGDWSAPVNTFSAWKNRNVAKGPFVAHMYTVARPASLGAGNGYRPSVWVYEPSSGKLATAQLTGAAEIFVDDPNVVYGGVGPSTGTENTICINPTSGTGFDDFSEAPAGAAHINADNLNATVISAYQNDGPKRIMLKRGSTYNLDNWWVSGEGMTITAYGTGAKPVLNVPNLSAINDNRDAALTITGGYANGTNKDFRIEHVKMLGDFDPTVEVDADRYGISTPFCFTAIQNVKLMMHDVEQDGIYMGMALYGDTNGLQHFHLDDCIGTNLYGNYPYYLEFRNSIGSSGVMTGCRIAQPPGAHSQDSAGSASTHSLLRWNSVSNVHIRGCDFFLTDFVHNALRINSGARQDGSLINIHSTTTEGGSGSIVYAGDPANGLNRTVVSNAIFDGIVYLGTGASEAFIQSISTGMTVRNCLSIIPNTLRENTVHFQAWLKLKYTGSPDQTIVCDAPVNMYNNTLVLFRPASQNYNNQIFGLWDESSGGAYTALNFDNNIWHQPDYTNQVIDTWAPLTTTRLPWDPRNIGLRKPASMGTLDTDYATPVAEVAYYRPTSPSTAIDNANTSQKVAFSALDDIFTQTQVSPRSVGAWED